MQHDDAFQNWVTERQSVEAQMDEILASRVPPAPEERQVRRVQFLALIERRDIAARSLLNDLRRRQSQCRVVKKTT